ncbi:MAG: hypothetical protein RL671_573 [Pseudomonadota bacterium]|jgi:hypothetical protein|uniref:hypothetical protein n=1 Tax=Novosphingobium sp. APW14 TaxID=3077237 RepID=UPI0028E041BF|nr:hypothetical protein [Novosphingobium sp. APW14]MDT9012588.1 hypothetical protein [Novosphingobium sp. APW14]
MRRLILPILLIATPAAATSGEMSVATFLSKADALKAKGFMALGSSDMKLLRDEGQAAGMAYSARLQQERAAGKPSSCPPKSARPSSSQVLEHLRTYPAGKRANISMKAAMADYFIKNYPCR